MDNHRLVFRFILMFSVLSALLSMAISIMGLEQLPIELAAYQERIEKAEPAGIELALGLFGVFFVGHNANQFSWVMALQKLGTLVVSRPNSNYISRHSIYGPTCIGPMGWLIQ